MTARRQPPGQIAAQRVRAGGYDSRTHANAQVVSAALDVRPPLKKIHGRVTLAYDAPLMEGSEGQLLLDFEALATLMAGSGLQPSGRRVALISADNIKPVDQLKLNVSAAYTESEVQAIVDRLDATIARFDALLLAMKRAKHMKEV